MNFATFFYCLIPGSYFTLNLLLIIYSGNITLVVAQVSNGDTGTVAVFSVISIIFGFIFYGVRNYMYMPCSGKTLKEKVNFKAIALVRADEKFKLDDDVSYLSDKDLIALCRKINIMLWYANKYKVHDHYSTISTMFTNLFIAGVFSCFFYVAAQFALMENYQIPLTSNLIILIFSAWFAVMFRRSEFEVCLKQEKLLDKK